MVAPVLLSFDSLQTHSVIQIQTTNLLSGNLFLFIFTNPDFSIELAGLDDTLGIFDTDEGSGGDVDSSEALSTASYINS